MEAGCAPMGSHGPLGVRGGGGLLVWPFKEVPLFSIVFGRPCAENGKRAQGPKSPVQQL